MVPVKRVASDVLLYGAPLAALIALSGCGSRRAPGPEVQETTVPDAIAGMQASPAQAEKGRQIGTPNKDRVVTLGVLNKRNNLTQDLVMKPGDSRRMGNLVVKVATCEKTLPWERPKEEGAFVQVFVEQRDTAKAKLAWHKVFSGWLFKNSPALNVVENPVYDVWVKKCDMHFPGEESGSPAPVSDNSAAKPSGTAKASRPPVETESAAPVASSTPGESVDPAD